MFHASDPFGKYRYSRIVNKGIAKVEAILKTVMSPTEPYEGYVENYLLLISDKHVGNFTRLLDLKGLKKPEQGPLLDMFSRRIPHHDNLVDNSNFLPTEISSPTSTHQTVLPNITTSLTSMASTAAQNFSNNPSSPFKSSSTSSPTQSSPTSAAEGTRGRLNENFRKLVMTGMAFRKDMQERRGDHHQSS